MQSNRNFLMGEYYRRKVCEFEPRFRFSNQSRENFALWKKELLKLLKDALGKMPESVDLNTEVISEIEQDGIIRIRVLIDLEKDMSAPVWIYVPEQALRIPAPAILCCHGHGKFGKDSVMGVRISKFPEREDEIKGYNYDYGLQMAKHGYVTAAIDWRGFGERSEGNVFWGRDECNINYIKSGLMGYNLLALNIFDGMRVIDYLETLDFVDSQKIGCMGLSFGGTMTAWMTIMDERIKAADIICYSAKFAEFALQRGNFCGSQIFFNLFGFCDVPDLHGLIAPRPLLAEIGLLDLCFRADEAITCSDEVKKIYSAAGAAQNYHTDIFNGGHQFGGNKAFDFFDRNLKLI
jgi:hypothetical protein